MSAGSDPIGSGEHEAREALLDAMVDGVIFDCGPQGDTLTLLLKGRGYGIRLSAEGRIAITLAINPTRDE